MVVPDTSEAFIFLPPHRRSILQLYTRRACPPLSHLMFACVRVPARVCAFVGARCDSVCVCAPYLPACLLLHSLSCLLDCQPSLLALPIWPLCSLPVRCCSLPACPAVCLHVCLCSIPTSCHRTANSRHHYIDSSHTPRSIAANAGAYEKLLRNSRRNSCIQPAYLRARFHNNASALQAI